METIEKYQITFTNQNQSENVVIGAEGAIVAQSRGLALVPCLTLI